MNFYRLLRQSSIGLLVFGFLSFNGFTQNPYEEYKINWKDKPIPELTLQTIDNQTITSQSLRGKVYLLNFWFTNCSGCKIEYPGLQTLKNRFSATDNVAFISIANDDTAKLKQFLQKNPLNFQHVANGQFIGESNFGILGYPTNFIVDENGIIRHVKIGGSAGSADDIEYEMKQLLKTKH